MHEAGLWLSNRELWTAIQRKGISVAFGYAQVAGIKTGVLAVSDIIGGVACKEPCLLAHCSCTHPCQQPTTISYYSFGCGI